MDRQNDTHYHRELARTRPCMVHFGKAREVSSPRQSVMK